jgi:hypothetical protein
MTSLRQILYESLLSTSRFPRWWILALAQVAALYAVGELAHPHWLKPLFFCWLIVGVVVLVLTTAWLWLEIQSVKLKSENNIAVKIFIGLCRTTGVIVICSMMVIALARLVFAAWIVLALVSSVVAATATLAILYAVLCREPFYKALVLALDTWNRKISLAAIVAFILILAHGVSFALVHGLLKSSRNMYGFSVYSHSATIWVLFFFLIFLVAFVSAVLNYFLVLLFLETIRQKKDPEAETAVLKKLSPSEAGY